MIARPAPGFRGNLEVTPDGTLECRYPTQAGGCFVAGTLVHTKEGLVPIEQLKVGDWVLSKPENGQGEQAYKRVTNTFKFENKEVMLLEIVPMSEFDRARKSSTKNYITPSDIRDEMKQHLVCTPNHPFWVEEVGWTAASMLDGIRIACSWRRVKSLPCMRRAFYTVRLWMKKDWHGTSSKNLKPLEWCRSISGMERFKLFF